VRLKTIAKQSYSSLLLGGELITERCRTDDLMPSIPFLSLPPSRVDPKVLGPNVLVYHSQPGGSWTTILYSNLFQEGKNRGIIKVNSLILSKLSPLPRWLRYCTVACLLCCQPDACRGRCNALSVYGFAFTALIDVSHQRRYNDFWLTLPCD